MYTNFIFLRIEWVHFGNFWSAKEEVDWLIDKILANRKITTWQIKLMIDKFWTCPLFFNEKTIILLHHLLHILPQGGRGDLTKIYQGSATTWGWYPIPLLMPDDFPTPSHLQKSPQITTKKIKLPLRNHLQKHSFFNSILVYYYRVPFQGKYPLPFANPQSSIIENTYS